MASTTNMFGSTTQLTTGEEIPLQNNVDHAPAIEVTKPETPQEGGRRRRSKTLKRKSRKHGRKHARKSRKHVRKSRKHGRKHARKSTRHNKRVSRRHRTRHNRRRPTRRHRSSMRGGYAQFGTNVPFSTGYGAPTTLSPSESALANPIQIQRTLIAPDNYNHYTGAHAASPVLDQAVKN